MAQWCALAYSEETRLMSTSQQSWPSDREHSLDLQRFSSNTKHVIFPPQFPDNWASSNWTQSWLYLEQCQIPLANGAQSHMIAPLQMPTASPTSDSWLQTGVSISFLRFTRMNYGPGQSSTYDYDYICIYIQYIHNMCVLIMPMFKEIQCWLTNITYQPFPSSLLFSNNMFHLKDFTDKYKHIELEGKMVEFQKDRSRQILLL